MTVFLAVSEIINSLLIISYFFNAYSLQRKLSSEKWLFFEDSLINVPWLLLFRVGWDYLTFTLLGLVPMRTM